MALINFVADHGPAEIRVKLIGVPAIASSLPSGNRIRDFLTPEPLTRVKYIKDDLLLSQMRRKSILRPSPALRTEFYSSDSLPSFTLSRLATFIHT